MSEYVAEIDVLRRRVEQLESDHERDRKEIARLQDALNRARHVSIFVPTFVGEKAERWPKKRIPMEALNTNCQTVWTSMPSLKGRVLCGGPNKPQQDFPKLL